MHQKIRLVLFYMVKNFMITCNITGCYFEPKISTKKLNDVCSWDGAQSQSKLCQWHSDIGWVSANIVSITEASANILPTLRTKSNNILGNTNASMSDTMSLLETLLLLLLKKLFFRTWRYVLRHICLRWRAHLSQ